MQDFLDRHPTLARLARLRMADWVVVALLLWGAVALLAPQQLPVSLYKMSLVALAAVAGFWIDRSLFPYARPDRFLDPAPLAPGAAPQRPETAFTDLASAVSFAEADLAQAERLALARSAMLRRAIIVGATMLAVCLGA